jgi:hypothetical protein
MVRSTFVNLKNFNGGKMTSGKKIQKSKVNKCDCIPDVSVGSGIVSRMPRKRVEVLHSSGRPLDTSALTKLLPTSGGNIHPNLKKLLDKKRPNITFEM